MDMRRTGNTMQMQMQMQPRLSAHAASVVRAWWALSEQLLVWYAEGNCNGCPHATGSGRHFGYPAWWLKDAGYADPLP